MSTTTKNLGLFKYDIVADENVPFSITNALNNNWDILDEAVKGGGSSRNVGEIIYSFLPLTDAGLHLLDGSLIQGGGIYQEFVDYMANVYKTKDRTYNPSAFTITGSPTITSDGIASGFSNNNYLTGSHSNITPTISIELNCRVTLNSMPNTTERIWSSQNDASFFLAARDDGSLNFRIKEEAYDTGVSLASGGFVFGEYVDLYARVTTTNVYFKTTTQQGITQERNVTISNPFTALSSFRFGIGGTYIGHPFTSGSIDLKQFSITVDGKEVFNGSTPANYFTDETTWQNSISQYGVCGKFVYDSLANTVRLPKITGILEGTTDVAALGDLIEAGLPVMTTNSMGNHNHSLWAEVWRGSDGNNWRVAWDGGDRYIGSATAYTNSTGAHTHTVTWGADVNTVQPQTIKAFYYIVIANSTKTDIQVDIDEIATDLNDKVDKADLEEVQCVVETYQNGTSWYRVYSDGWCEQGGKTDVLPSNVNTTISFLKTFANTNYNITACERYDGGTSDNNNENYWVSSVSTSSFQLYNSAGGYKQLYWQACGYIEV